MQIRSLDMTMSRRFSITLPNDTAKLVEAKVKSGAYASVSEVVRDGVESLLDRDAAVERWLHEDVVAGHEEYLADPSRAVPLDAILDRIRARRTARRS
jgi:putative addiction module CopG family antidote